MLVLQVRCSPDIHCAFHTSAYTEEDVQSVGDHFGLPVVILVRRPLTRLPNMEGH